MPDTVQHGQTTHNTFDPLAKATGIAAGDMYRMSGLFMNELALISLPINAHRLLHALLHATCRSLPQWSPDVEQPDDGFRTRSVVLRNNVGLLGTNCNRNLREGIDCLLASELFDWLSFIHGNEFIQWRFKDHILAVILDQRGYGLLDKSGLRNLKNATDYQVFGLSSLARRMRKPEFSFTVAHATIWADHDIPAWSAVSSKVVKALGRSCEHYGLTAFMLLGRQGDLRGIDSVTVRFWRPGCCWKATALAYTPGPTVKCVAVDGSDSVTVEPEAFPALLERLRKVRWRVGGLQDPGF